MSEPSDARKLALVILPVVTFGLVFYVMYQNERYRAPDWHRSALAPQRAAELSDEELARAIAKEWVRKAVAKDAVARNLTVTVDSRRRLDDPSPLKATVAGAVHGDGASKPVEMKIAVRVEEKRVTYCVEEWDLD